LWVLTVKKLPLKKQPPSKIAKQIKKQIRTPKKKD
jgi:hypothetical protein